MTIRVLICRSNPVAPDPRVEKIAGALAGLGYPVQILCWDRTGQLASGDELEGQGERIPIHRLPIVGKFGHGLGNLPGLLRWQWGLSRWLAAHRREFDLLHACDFDTILPALMCKWLWGKKLVYDIFDFYADHLRATPETVKTIIRWLDLLVIGQADAVILADDARREQISSANPKRLEVIYNSPAETALPSDLTAQKEAASSAFRLAYIGLLQVERGLLEMLAALEGHPEWVLDLAGFGGDQERILIKAVKMHNVRWHGRVSYDQALRLSQEADVLFATYDPAIPNHRYASPNKLFEAMLLGKPIIVARHTNMDRIVERTQCGILVDYGDIHQLESALVHLQQDEDLRNRLGVNARQAYEREYSWPIMQSRLASLYAAIAGDSD